MIDEAADETVSKMFVVVLGTVVANEAGQVVLLDIQVLHTSSWTSGGLLIRILPPMMKDGSRNMRSGRQETASDDSPANDSASGRDRGGRGESAWNESDGDVRGQWAVGEIPY